MEGRIEEIGVDLSCGSYCHGWFECGPVCLFGEADLLTSVPFPDSEASFEAAWTSTGKQCQSSCSPSNVTEPKLESRKRLRLSVKIGHGKRAIMFIPSSLDVNQLYRLTLS